MTPSAKSEDAFDPPTRGRFELHSIEEAGCEGGDLAAAPWGGEPSPTTKVQATISANDGVVWTRLDENGAGLSRASREEAVAGFRVVRRRLGDALAMIAPRDGVLVNGMPPLPLAILSVKDSVVLAPGRHFYLTQRLKPFVGAPPQRLLKKPCPFCSIPLAEDTRIYLCPCGAAYHYETAESHGHVEESERLNCLGKLAKCLSCKRRPTLEEFLEWDPAAM